MSRIILRIFLMVFFFSAVGFSLFALIFKKQYEKTTFQIISPPSKIQENTDQIIDKIKQNITTQITPINTSAKNILLTSLPTIPPSLASTRRPTVPTPTNIVQEWDVAKQIDKHTWTMKIGEDQQMETPEEIFLALNTYRSRHGNNPLSWNDNFARYAQTRVEYYSAIGKTDKHEGFIKFAKEPANLQGLGFNTLGENSSQGFRLNAVHLIEWLYAGNEPHNKNQLNPEWTHVGIAVKETFTELIFGGWKI